MPLLRSQTELPRVEAWERRFHIPLTILAAVFLVAYAVPILWPGLPSWVHTTALAVDVLVWAAFGVDYVARLIIAENRLLFVKVNLTDLVLLVVPPLRQLRLLRVAAMAVEAMWRHTKNHTRARLATFVLGTTVLLLLMASLAVLDAERGRAGAQIHDYGDAVWWTLVTVTTVGYGDAVPVTGEGRVVAVFLMLTGIGLIGFVTGSVTSWVVEKIAAMSRDQETVDVGAVLTSVHTLRAELTVVRDELAQLRAEMADRPPVSGQADSPR
ncbi:voltage-gated potassium channel [Stackebrandtia albiflava]|uniref:Voltage-gated potassium channel n=1 Tax=Stackebrandtia albiflava TaxID=406432 RepID=A0A562VDL4_9ACTN|nr:potassium channel family protein [Stackebrandtia albiflava]TWJ15948.1 voltage-gated potassium channel [Stackebrandtia albiflava]